MNVQKLIIACCQLLIDIPNAQVSDTTGDAIYFAACKKIFLKKIIQNIFSKLPAECLPNLTATEN